MRALTEATVLAIHSLHCMLLQREPVSVKEISRTSGFPADRIRQVIERLRQAGLLKSLPGRGYVLARGPGEISILDIVRSIEEPVPPKAPCGGDYDACQSRASCILAPLCHHAGENEQEVLRSFTLADLMGTRLDLPNCLDPKLGLKTSSRWTP